MRRLQTGHQVAPSSADKLHATDFLLNYHSMGLCKHISERESSSASLMWDSHACSQSSTHRDDLYYLYDNITIAYSVTKFYSWVESKTKGEVKAARCTTMR